MTTRIPEHTHPPTPLDGGTVVGPARDRVNRDLRERLVVGRARARAQRAPTPPDALEAIAELPKPNRRQRRAMTYRMLAGAPYSITAERTRYHGRSEHVRFKRTPEEKAARAARQAEFVAAQQAAKRKRLERERLERRATR